MNINQENKLLFFILCFSTVIWFQISDVFILKGEFYGPFTWISFFFTSMIFWFPAIFFSDRVWLWLVKKMPATRTMHIRYILYCSLVGGFNFAWAFIVSSIYHYLFLGIEGIGSSFFWTRIIYVSLFGMPLATYMASLQFQSTLIEKEKILLDSSEQGDSFEKAKATIALSDPNKLKKYKEILTEKEFIAAIMDEAGFSRKEIAEFMGVKPGTISNYKVKISKKLNP